MGHSIHRPWRTIPRQSLQPCSNRQKNQISVVEPVPSTNFQSNEDRLKDIFATYGMPKRQESDNGPLFNSTEFDEFAMQKGFQRHKVNPLHPKANGEAERLMQTLNKTEKFQVCKANTRHADCREITLTSSHRNHTS